MKNVTWDSYQLFLDVSRSGGLTGAAALTGLSPATIGRRMIELEERIGKALFQRSQTGYALTPDGRALFDRLQAMENAAKDIEGWQKASSASSVVRVAVGTWNAWLLTGKSGARLWVAADGSAALLRAVGPKTRPSDLSFTDWDRAERFRQPTDDQIVTNE